MPDDAAFGVQALPYGCFTRAGEDRPRVGLAVGDRVLDLTAAASTVLPSRAALFDAGTLHALFAAGPAVWREVREALQDALVDDRQRDQLEPLLIPAADALMRLPFRVADYVDFYASEHHVTNAGRIMRPGQDPLPPNWKHLPVGYHGRAGTVIVSGTPVVRPCGQWRTPDGDVVFGPSQRLDFEAEVGFVIGAPSRPGRPVPLRDFPEHVFGVCLVNDWSARDLQAWESVPLGPLSGKSFATSVSPWVLPLAALESARIQPPPRQVPLLPYLDDGDSEPWGLDLRLRVQLNGQLVSRPPFAAMYWTAAQQLAQLTANGARLRIGDLHASGTVSGPERDQAGSLLELSWGGTEPLTLPDGSSRTFLQDGDEVVVSAVAPGAEGGTVGLGEVRGRVLAAG